jgi:uncharacterized membrane protein YdjX (TVP38/TMEM64 family)
MGRDGGGLRRLSPERVGLVLVTLALALGLLGGAAPGAGLWPLAAALRARADWAMQAFKAVMDDLDKVLVDAGAMGPVIVFFIYLVTTVFMLPLWGFHLVCGYVYGPFWASLLIATTQAICASAAFSFSRYVVGPHVRGWLVRRYGRKFEAIDRAVSNDGFKVVLLLRLSPIIPFGINNYICGVSAIKLADFALATFLGELHEPLAQLAARTRRARRTQPPGSPLLTRPLRSSIPPPCLGLPCLICPAHRRFAR